MTFKQYLKSLEWNTFEFYPLQGKPIYLNCHATNYGTEKLFRKFVRVDKFNAVSFCCDSIRKKYHPNISWEFKWLPADDVERLWKIHEASK